MSLNLTSLKRAKFGRHITLLVVIVCFAATGYGLSGMAFRLWFHHDAVLYHVENSLQPTAIGWQDLMGEEDKFLLQQLQRNTTALLTPGQTESSGISEEQRLLASVLKAQTWQGLDGYQINRAMAQQNVSIPGFMVPLEVDGQQVRSFFVVPYFGACLHFPPPPPNQMFYVQLPNAIALPALDKPYLFSGTLNAELFEDPLGTSAWSMEVMTINQYAEQADDAREHRF